MTKRNSPGCCNATATAILAALTDRIKLESAGVTNPDFLRGLQVAKALVYESIGEAR
ncbi:hypothetical protein KYJ26_16980 [Bacillus sp. MCCB 382]|uniref:hypothetical protein n=1 Tax=Bacillus sp. MCCB 382 TaxID=2860197 RepID=UPI001C592334|nr:hypothetical protein [Bacillus sp. MCCB 382]